MSVGGGVGGCMWGSKGLKLYGAVVSNIVTGVLGFSLAGQPSRVCCFGGNI